MTTRILRILLRILLCILLCLLTFATSAQAESAWVLWSQMSGTV